MRFSAIQIAAYAIVGLAFSPVALAAPVGCVSVFDSTPCPMQSLTCEGLWNGSDGDFHAREARLLVPPTQPIHDIPTDQPVSQRDIANAGDEIFERRTPDMNMHSHFGRHSSEHDGGRYVHRSFAIIYMISATDT